MTKEELISECQTIGIQIRTIREAKKMSQEQLAIKSGLSTGTIGKIERGENIPKADTLVRIAYELDIPCKLLFDMETMNQEYNSPQIYRLMEYLKHINDEDMAALCTIAKKMAINTK